MNNFEQAVSVAKTHFPNLKIKYKDDSFFMKFLSYVLFFNKDFMSKYITTIGETIYYPSKQHVMMNEENAVNVLCHELVHVQQSKNNKLFKVKYLFPQILSVFALLALFAFWTKFALLALVFLVFLIPMPAAFRAEYEYEAYVTTMYCKFVRDNEVSPNTMIHLITQNFTTSSYYWMDREYGKIFGALWNEFALIEAGVNDLFGMKEIIDSVLGV